MGTLFRMIFRQLYRLSLVVREHDVFSSIFADLSDFLNERYVCQEPPLHLENEQQLELF